MNTNRLVSTLEQGGLNVKEAEGGTELVVRCPLCFDEAPRLYISADSGQWICFRCDERGSLRTLLTQVCEIPLKDAILVEREIWGGEKRGTITVPRPAPPSEVRLPPGFQLDNGDGPAAHYFAQRGLSSHWLAEMGIGYCLVGLYTCRVIVPVLTQGYLRTFVARSWLPNAKKKVLMPKGSQAERALFGYDALDSDIASLIVVEGVFDAIHMWDMGYLNTVATLGAHITDLQRGLMKRLAPECVVLLRDGDEAGRTAATKESKELAYAMTPVSIAQLPDGKDPGSATSKEIQQALDTAQSVS